jgi:hypothetical protein
VEKAYLPFQHINNTTLSQDSVRNLNALRLKRHDFVTVFCLVARRREIFFRRTLV